MKESSKGASVLSSASNLAVVQLPGRRFPGSVIQGDSLSNLFSLACAVEDQASASSNAELTQAARELRELIEGRLRAYDRVLLQAGIQRPYVPPKWRGSEGDA
jgi:hypothetical protein